MRVLSFCLLPKHWHLVLWPVGDGDLSEYLRWLTNTHTRRWHSAQGTVGTGPLYQGRFKSFPIQADQHFVTVCRDVERNALRADLVARAEDWRWSSLWHRANSSSELRLDDWPVPRGREWVESVNAVETEAELQALRRSAQSGTPCGTPIWQQRTAKRLG